MHRNIGVAFLLAGAIAAAIQNSRAAERLRVPVDAPPADVCSAARYERWNGATVLGADGDREIFQRFAPVSTALPPLTRVGFATDAPSMDRSIPSTERFLMTRFAVVPLVVDPKATGLTLGDFPNTPRTEVEKRWRVVRDFGRGVYFLQPR